MRAVAYLARKEIGRRRLRVGQNPSRPSALAKKVARLLQIEMRLPSLSSLATHQLNLPNPYHVSETRELPLRQVGSLVMSCHAVARPNLAGRSLAVEFALSTRL